MKIDGFPGEKTILSLKLTNGVEWLTTHRLIIPKDCKKEKRHAYVNSYSFPSSIIWMLLQ